MQMRIPAAPRRRLAALAASIALLLAVAACAPAAPTDGPGAIVSEALAKVAAKDLDGLRGLACSGQEDLIRDQLGFPGAIGTDLIPGIDTDALLGAVNLDVADVKLGDPAIEGDVAQVPVTGTLTVTFDAEAMKPILRQFLESQGGTTMTDAQLDALLKTFATQGQDVPLEESVRLIRESGDWKICQETVAVPAAS
ncbi:MAG TPA: hypothetical protein VES19_08680 [Candidatus Limnocylindrales bacterium]|nr:hypothetical protein [Candidatus Limnocylindrales bacterium]